MLEPLRRNLAVGPPRRNLAVEPPRTVPLAPQTGAPATTVTASDLLSGDDPGPQRVGRLPQAAAALRRDIVLIRSASLFIFGALVVLYIALLVNINRTGLHRFYRDRLSKAYLFDPQDPAGDTGRADRLKLTDIDPQHAGNPYHLVNTALNVPATDIPDLQGRRTDFFAMAPRWCGSSATEFHATRAYEDDYDRDINLGTAFAISGAAAAPQMGVNSSRPLALVMSLLNIRLDYWLPNLKILKDGARPPSRRPGPGYLLREISGRMTDETPFVNLSDGGHIENLGLYELLRRRCKYIICCDAEQDPDMILSSLGKLTAYARMDEGIWIDWGGTLRKLRRDPDTGYSRAHWAVGTIHYGDGKTGRIVYRSHRCAATSSPTCSPIAPRIRNSLRNRPAISSSTNSSSRPTEASATSSPINPSTTAPARLPTSTIGSKRSPLTDRVGFGTVHTGLGNCRGGETWLFTSSRRSLDLADSRVRPHDKGPVSGALLRTSTGLSSPLSRLLPLSEQSRKPVSRRERW